MTVRSAPRWFSISFRPPPPVRPRLDLAIVRARAESPVLDFTGGERGTRTLDLGIMSLFNNQYRTVAVTMSGSMRSLASSGAH